MFPNQDKGIAHCHYIRLLTNEIWCKENDRSTGRKMKWEDCMRKAFELHRRKLIGETKPPILPRILMF